jgi:hypothetical protein
MSQHAEALPTIREAAAAFVRAQEAYRTAYRALLQSGLTEDQKIDFVLAERAASKALTEASLALSAAEKREGA